MSLPGQNRAPQRAARDRRNQDALASTNIYIAELLADAETPVATNGGLEYVGDELAINLTATNSGLGVTAAGLRIRLASPASGLNFSSDDLLVDVRADEGLSIDGSGLGTVLDGTSITRSASGLRVTHQSGRFTIGSVQTGAGITISGVGIVHRLDPTSGAQAGTLPTAAGLAGLTVIFKNVGASTNTITINANGAETIDGAGSATITSAYGTLRLMSDGTNWMLV